jgi:hypothetical protein
VTKPDHIADVGVRRSGHVLPRTQPDARLGASRRSMLKRSELSPANDSLKAELES